MITIFDILFYQLIVPSIFRNVLEFPSASTVAYVKNPAYAARVVFTGVEA